MTVILCCHSHVTQVQVQMALTIDDFADVQSAIWAARSKWYNIGVQLRLSVPDLQAIDNEPGLDLESKFRKMIISWLERGQRCTWRALRETLKHHAVNLPGLAQQLETNCGLDKSKNSFSFSTCMCLGCSAY